MSCDEALHPLLRLEDEPCSVRHVEPMEVPLEALVALDDLHSLPQQARGLEEGTPLLQRLVRSCLEARRQGARQRLREVERARLVAEEGEARDQALRGEGKRELGLGHVEPDADRAARPPAAEAASLHEDPRELGPVHQDVVGPVESRGHCAGRARTVQGPQARGHGEERRVERRVRRPDEGEVEAPRGRAPPRAATLAAAPGLLESGVDVAVARRAGREGL